MPYKALKKCRFAGCPELTDESYCPEHRRQVLKSRDMNRETAGSRGYNHRWGKVRDMKLANDPLCQDCEKEGITKTADMVHHLDGDSRHNEGENLRSLCWFHHGKHANDSG